MSDDSPHADYAISKLEGTRNAWVTHAARDADRAYLALRRELGAIEFKRYLYSLTYDPHSGDNGRVDARIAELRLAREQMVRALTELGINVDDFGDYAAAKEQTANDERLADMYEQNRPAS